MAALSDIPALFSQAVAHQQAGRHAEAERLCRAILEADPGQADALHLLGGLALQGGRPDLAIPPLERAAAAHPEEPVYHATLGQAYLQAGDGGRALACFREAARAAPDFAPAHFLIGMVLRSGGRAAEARQAFEAALRLQPDFVPALFNLGALLQEGGDSEGAAEQYRRAIAQAPDFAEAHLNLGICLAQGGDPRGGDSRGSDSRGSDSQGGGSRGGDPRAALPHLERAVALRPDLLEARLALGNALLESGEAERAIAAYRDALALQPRSAQAHFNLGNAFRREGRLEAALAAYRDALAAEPRLVQAAINSGSACDELGRHDEAEAHFRRAIELDPGAALAHAGLSAAARRRGETEAAQAIAERAIALDARCAEAHVALALCHQERGRFEAAATSFRDALAADPACTTALYNLAMLRSVEPSAAELAALERAVALPRLGVKERSGLHFALASLADKRGEYDAAFRHYRAANDLKAEQEPFSEPNFAALVDGLMRIFDKPFLDGHKAFGASSERPIFVLGMPRSGTTLVEQILASHPEVHGSGEISALAAVIHALEGLPGPRWAQKPYPEAASLIGKEEAAALAELYLEASGKEAGGAARVTDKLPGNFLHIGLIALLLPRARIIHCRRDPFDTCLSCYFQNFEEAQPFARRLDRLGQYYRQYERLMAHWRQVLPRPMLEVAYEALVAEPEPWCRRILEHCGLAWDERVLQFFATERSVRTASYWQVRQPIYQSSVARWRHYRQHLGPLFEALGRRPDADAAE